MKHLLFCLILFCSLLLKSQDRAPKLPRFSTRINCGTPKYVSSELMYSTFNGVLVTDINVNYRLFSNFFIGLGYSFTYSQADKELRDQFIHPHSETHNGFLKIGYDSFFSATGFATFSINAGLNNTTFKGIMCKNDTLIGQFPTQFNCPFVEPQIGLYYFVESHVAIGGNIGYNFNFIKFDSRYSCTENRLSGQGKMKNNWNISSINLSFGMYIGLGKMK